MKAPLDWKAFLDQKAVVKFGANIMANYEAFAIPDFAEKHILPELAHNIAEGVWRQGYRPIEDTGGLWPREMWGIADQAMIVGTFRAQLTARPEQFLSHVEHFIRWQSRTIVERSSWRGFLRWKWGRLKERMRRFAKPADQEEANP